ncbi:very-long-chain 3-oxoacyl-CoA reductase-like isoform X2 [Babylonia areolata]|uniref:very-long-chain 3-oxoacyl-CoA reductase-like isoform X2 n=1 Tax=Babylonia areolata TaxID=304850 RepID=UPI003FD23CC7
MASYFGRYADCLCVVGAVSAGYVALRVCSHILRVTYRAVRRCFPVDPKHYGRWAVVTGSTDGIGKSYALQLAEKGMDIVLISRNPQKLSAVAEQIVQHFQVSVKVITADFKKTDIYDNIKQQLTGLDIGVLVNNVGMVDRQFQYFCESDDFEQQNRDTVNVNVLSCVMMTSIVLPEMVQRKRGAIINLSSVFGLRPSPFMTVYSATKVVCPCPVKSNLTSGVSRVMDSMERWFYPTSDVYVTAALNTIGREPCTTAYWRHELTVPGFLMASDSSLTSYLRGVRNRMMEVQKED